MIFISKTVLRTEGYIEHTECRFGRRAAYLEKNNMLNKINAKVIRVAAPYPNEDSLAKTESRFQSFMS